MSAPQTLAEVVELLARYVREIDERLERLEVAVAKNTPGKGELPMETHAPGTPSRRGRARKVVPVVEAEVFE
jgi:hypothetical protein